MAVGLRAARGFEARRPQLNRGRLPAAPSPDAALAGAPFPPSFFLHPVEDVARALLGSCLVSSVGGERCAVIVVEAEAYGGSDDAASHAATRSGVTTRNRAMFGPPGRAYVYRSYGIHWCLNVVTGADGDGQAVLLRGGVPLVGRAVMASRREGRRPLTTGPGRLAQALGVTDALYGHDLSRTPLRLLSGWSVPDELVGRSGRIGVTAAADRLHRFYVGRWPGSGVPRSAHPVEEIDP